MAPPLLERVDSPAISETSSIEPISADEPIESDIPTEGTSNLEEIQIPSFTGVAVKKCLAVFLCLLIVTSLLGILLWRNAKKEENEANDKVAEAISTATATILRDVPRGHEVSFGGETLTKENFDETLPRWVEQWKQLKFTDSEICYLLNQCHQGVFTHSMGNFIVPLIQNGFRPTSQSHNSDLIFPYEPKKVTVDAQKKAVKAECRYFFHKVGEVTGEGPKRWYYMDTTSFVDLRTGKVKSTRGALIEFHPEQKYPFFSP